MKNDLFIINNEFAEIPYLAQIGLTYNCNYNCPHCYAKEYKNIKDTLSQEEIFHLFDQLFECGTVALTYSHGENLLRKDFSTITKYAQNKGLYQTLLTNGYLIQNHELCENIRACGIDRVLVSLDSSIPEMHNANRQNKDAYNKAINSLKLLNEVGFNSVGISFAINDANSEQIFDIIEIAISLKIKELSIMTCRDTTSFISWTKNQLSTEIFELIEQNKNNLEIHLHDPLLFNHLNFNKIEPELLKKSYTSNLCNVGKSLISIDPKGNVRACNFLNKVFGNIKEENVNNIWREIVAYYANYKIHDICKKCNSYEMCEGGCKAFHFKKKKDIRCKNFETVL
jgi:radical SAM protein with 4Fe4S-binding SPASM domain